jgi:hypothetical protein
MAYSPTVRSTVDTGNSTTAALGAAGVFPGSWNDIEVWNGISVILNGTAASTAPGTLVMQFSHDGVTVLKAITVAVGDVVSASPRTLGVLAKYFRVVYTNGAQAQITFSLQTMLHSSQVNPVSRLDDGFDNVDVTNVRAVPSGQQPDGDYVNGKADGTAFSDSTPLVAGDTYNSGWVDADGWVTIELFLTSDQLSAVSGISVQYTDDVQGAATVRATDNYTFTQNDLDRGYLALTFPTRLDGFRIQYTNGSAPQGSFFIQADLRTNSSPLRTDSSGALITGDFTLEVALGNIPNHTNGTKFGAVGDIDNADPTPVTVWRAGDSGSAFRRKTFATVAANLWVASTDNADTADITLIINDASNTLVTATVTLTGQTPVDTGVSALDCNTAYVSGNDQTLAGDVWVTNANNFVVPGVGGGVPNDPTEVQAYIPAADGRTQQAVYRVPANTTMVIREFHASMLAGTGQAAAKVKVLVCKPGESWYTLRPYLMSSNFSLERPELIALPAGTFVEVVLDDVASNNTDTTVIFNYDLIVGA